MNYASSNITKEHSRMVAANFECLVELRDAGSKYPVFCIHPSGGDVGIYRKLARSLRNQSSIGIQSQMNCGSPIEYSCVSQMAEAYAKLIDQQQPLGPIRLIGFSLGGFIANAIANQLGELHRDVSFLGLIDSDLCWVFEESAIRRDLTERLEQVSLNLQNGGLLNKMPIAKLKHDVAVVVDYCLEGLSPECIARELEARGHTARLKSDSDRFHNFVLRFSTHCQMINSFRPSSMEMPVHLWWPSDDSEKQELRNQYWRDYATEEVSESTIEGSHYSMMKMPHVKQLAAEIASALEKSVVAESQCPPLA